MKNETKAILCGYYGQGNGGDEALLVSLLQMLPGSIEPIVLSGNPSHTQKTYGVTSYDRKSTFPILKALRQGDLFIWGGGSLMQDATSVSSAIYYAGLMSIAQQQGLKTIAWGQGIGPLKYSFSRWLAKNVLSHCNAISVRDEASLKILTDWQIEATIAPDPVWALESKSDRNILSNIPTPRIAVVLRQHPQLTKKRLDLLIQALLKLQKATSAFILIIPFQPTSDREIAEKIHNKLPQISKIISHEDPRILKGLFQGVKMTIGMRLHSLIMAASESSCCFGLSYDPKVSQLMLELNLPGEEIAQLPHSEEAIFQRWLNCYQNSQPLNKDIIQSLKNRALLHKQLIVNC